MIQGIDASRDGFSFGGHSSWPILSRTLPSAVAIALGALACFFAPPKARLVRLPRIADVATLASPEVAVAPNPFGALYDPGFSSGAHAPWLDRSLALEPKFEPVAPPSDAKPPVLASLEPPRPIPPIEEIVPLPPPRPAELEPTANPPAAVRRTAKAPDPAASPDNRTFIEKLLGLPQRTSPAPAPALAYASPETSTVRGTRGNLSGPSFSLPSIFSSSPSPSSRYDQYTAVYDLSAHTVYLPNGTRLEAHSGLGDRLDNVRYVSERDRGPTPPHLYDLTPREQSFHGVQALRLNPVGDGDLFGRAGLLAHSYMLGPNGDSNGCVSFRDYDAFLRAYQSGQVKRLAVVARLN